MHKLIAVLFRFFLARRYRVSLKGVDCLKGDQPILFLPNHQAMSDPQILMVYTYPFKKTVPVISETYYDIPGIKYFFDSLGAVPVSDLGRGSRDVSVLQTVTSQINAALGEGKNVLLYPAGHLSAQGYEKIINKQTAYQVVKQAEEQTKIIAVRISGLWGSMWSRAWEGHSPPLFKTYAKAIFYLLINGLFFLPKRKVTIEYIDVTQQAKEQAQKDKNEFNSFLERIYNIYGEEKVTYLKHYFWAPTLKRKLPQVIKGSLYDLSTTNPILDINQVPAEVFGFVKRQLVEIGDVPVEQIRMSASIELDLAMDSLSVVKVITAIETQYPSKHHIDMADIKTISDLCLLAMGRFTSAETSLKATTITHQVAKERIIEIKKQRTILDAFILKFSYETHQPFAHDNISGTITRKKFLLKSLVLSRHLIRRISKQRVGVLLPASQTTTLVVASLYLAKKNPVMFNWTLGKGAVEECIRLSEVDQIITVAPFYERIKDQLPEQILSKLVFLEKEVSRISVIDKMKGVLLDLAPRWFVVSKMPEIAVILFTSGSESAPKAVPLTSKNIMADLWGVMDIVKISDHNIMLASLPPFHSFGFTVLTIFPLITGLKVVYAPDPKDAKFLARMIAHTQATMLLLTPTFLHLLTRQAVPSQLSSLRLVLTGAESLSPLLVAECKKILPPHCVVTQGYGITECSPALSINLLEWQKDHSVGKIITGVEYKIVHPETMHMLEKGEEGLLLVRGSSVFKGYLDTSIPSPFVSIKNKMYYNTGDIVREDEDGFIFIVGRLKRFLKIAGEMISLPAIERVLIEKYSDGMQQVLAIEGVDEDNQSKIVLFSLLPLEKTAVNAYLLTQGFSALAKINEVVMVDEIPMLGTGKIDYKRLKSLILSR
jgi:acyl-CoA synthetase (AMP-forming)/AMP-acid ligase II/1-acyl-sn-glycerol-3-phosphate acyltransferase/acyl carrier protein